MFIDTAIKDYLLEIGIRKYTARTIKSYRLNLNTFSRYCQEVANVKDTEEITLAVVKGFGLFFVEKGRKGTYINSMLKTIKSFIQYCYEEGFGGFNTKKTFKWCKEEKPVIQAFKPKDIKCILTNCGGNTYLDIRDKCIITMFVETGIRCLELCSITAADIHDDFIIINGKNHKQRVVPITNALKKAMLRYEAAKGSYFALKTTDNNYFLSFHGKMLTNVAVECMVKRRADGVSGVRVSPHTFRHTFAQQQVKMGTDIYTISRLLGHESIAITQTYLNSLRDEDVINMTKNNSVIANL